ncbi:CHAD domain-containing protein [Neosynechococcus sphagnicola]|uniref:CHAD domain-containing protein n=1 Tax=Neosynechococcus sphagnicola TaxID=1501145 RepID=UPI00068AE1F6|nr:CHAD domain-containing protein [Neosynechococcus sphagnicola]
MKTQPLDLSIKLGDYGYQIIRENFQRFVDQEAAVLKDKDPEPLHQMRVGMRRLRTAVQVFSTAIALPKVVSDGSIGKIAKRLGKTRDLDVLQYELVTHYQPLLQRPERSNFDEVLKHLQQTRGESFLHLQETLNGDRYHKLKQAIQVWIDQPTFTLMGALSVREILPDLLLPLICQLFLHPGWLVGTTIQAGKVTLLSIENSAELNLQLEQFSDVLHDLRKQMKGVRYQAEFFSDFYEASYLQRIEEFRTIQDVLGQLQDHEVLLQFLASTLKGDLSTVLPTVNQILQQQQATFWQTWQPLQQHYLCSDVRQSLRSLLTTPRQLTPASSQTGKRAAKTAKQLHKTVEI